MTTTPSLAVEPKAITISQYEALQSDIQIAKQGAVESFDYEDPKGDKAARSYIAGLRKIRGRIESARKEAKSYALEYGRAVDAQAKALEAEILGLIEPHQQALDAIAQREKERVATYEAKLNSITVMVQKGSEEGASSTVLAALIAGLNGVVTSGMEEFQEAAEAEVANGLRLLNALHAAAVEREKREALEAAEAQRVAEEEAARRKAEEEARVQLQIKEAEERARQEAEDRARNERAAAAQAQAQAEERARQAEERAAAAEAQRLEQEKAIAEALQVGEEKRKERERLVLEAQEGLRRAEAMKRNDLAAQLAEALTGKTKTQVVELLLDGQLHPAVVIDWSKA